MSVTEASAIAEPYHKLFLAGRPVRVDGDGSPVKTEVVPYARSHLLSINPGWMNQNYMIAHEIAHVIEATDEEFFAPRLGLVDTKHAQPSPDKVWREVRVFAIHFNIYQHVGCVVGAVTKDTFSAFNARAFVVAGYLAPGEAPTFERRLRAAIIGNSGEDLGPNFFMPEWNRKMRLLTERVKKELA